MTGYAPTESELHRRAAIHALERAPLLPAPSTLREMHQWMRESPEVVRELELVSETARHVTDGWDPAAYQWEPQYHAEVHLVGWLLVGWPGGSTGPGWAERMAMAILESTRGAPW